MRGVAGEREERSPPSPPLSSFKKDGSGAERGRERERKRWQQQQQLAD